MRKIERLLADSWEIRTALVHGDYSPKNVLVHETETWLIDFEVILLGRSLPLTLDFCSTTCS